jgi:hypothetical protein
MCHASLPRSPSDVPLRRPSTPPKASRPNVFFPVHRDRLPTRRVSRSDDMIEESSLERWTMLLLCFTLCVVGIGLWLLMPGGAFFYILLITPAVAAIFVSLDQELHPDHWESHGEFAARMISLFAKTVLILFLLIGATSIALFAFCCVVFYNAVHH